jgi:hypothetical protein
LAPEISSTSICCVREGSVEGSEELESTIPNTVAPEVALVYIIKVKLDASPKEQMIKFHKIPPPTTSLAHHLDCGFKRNLHSSSLVSQLRLARTN